MESAMRRSGAGGRSRLLVEKREATVNVTCDSLTTILVEGLGPESESGPVEMMRKKRKGSVRSDSTGQEANWPAEPRGWAKRPSRSREGRSSP